MSKITTGLTIAGLLVIWFLWSELDTAKTHNATLQSANTVLADSVGRLDKERQTNERIALERLEVANSAQAAKAIFERKLHDEKLKNAAIRTYLDRHVPGPIVHGLLVRAGQGNACHQANPSSPVPGANDCAGLVTTQRLIEWTGDVVDALQSCNADKASIRQWAAE